MYIETIGDLARASEDTLRRRLGKIGEQLHFYASGLNDSPVLHIGESDNLHSEKLCQGCFSKRAKKIRQGVNFALSYFHKYCF